LNNLEIEKLLADPEKEKANLYAVNEKEIEEYVETVGEAVQEGAAILKSEDGQAAPKKRGRKKKEESVDVDAVLDKALEAVDFLVLDEEEGMM